MQNNQLSRRDCFRVAGAGLAAAGTQLLAAPRTFTQPLGVQIYTVRNEIPNNADATLKAIADIGYTEVEALHASLPTLAPIFKKYGLKPVSCHYITDKFLNDDKYWAAAVEEANQYGIEYMVLPYLGPSIRNAPGFFDKLIPKMNAAGEECAKHGKFFCYHNHAFEFASLNGARAIDRLLKETNPKNVFFEMDVFWVSAAGLDPVALLGQWKSRVKLVHLKDREKGMPTIYDEGKAQKSNFKEVGNGDLDFPAILKKAAAIGVKHYFVEQDQTPDPIASLRQSYEYLRKLKLS